ncbi:hypothetical protein C8Q80DRAFT_1167082 [Daedaleopsis nitida]|nr:hypothetical protein C8Q80DRAFT_1167082 [Daedaleopsis nitida]
MSSLSILAVSARQFGCHGSRVRNRAQRTHLPYTSFGQANDEILRAQSSTTFPSPPSTFQTKEAVMVMPPLDEIPEIPDEDDIQIQSATPTTSISPPHQPSTISATSVISSQNTDGDYTRTTRRKKYARGYVPTRPSSRAPRVLAPIPEDGQLVTIAKKGPTASRAPTPPPLLKYRGAPPRLPRALRGDAENQPPPFHVDSTRNGSMGKVRRVRAASRHFGQSGSFVNRLRF